MYVKLLNLQGTYDKVEKVILKLSTSSASLNLYSKLMKIKIKTKMFKESLDLNSIDFYLKIYMMEKFYEYKPFKILPRSMQIQ